MRVILAVAVALSVFALGCDTSSTATDSNTATPEPLSLLAVPSHGLTVQVGTVYTHKHQDVSITIRRILRSDAGDQVVTSMRINGNQVFESTVGLDALAATLTTPPDTWARAFVEEYVAD